MFEGGSLWKPPPLKNLLSKVLPPIQEVVKKGALSAKLASLSLQPQRFSSLVATVEYILHSMDIM
jgi:hypothetical protein